MVSKPSNLVDAVPKQAKRLLRLNINFKPLLYLQSLHQAQDLTDEQVNELANLADKKHFRATLDKILVPRVVGTANHKRVGDFIVNQMTNLGWDTSVDAFTDNTPIFGKLEFRNIIARLNPNADRYLLLACHYDSKYYREHAFVGKYIFFIRETKFKTKPFTLAGLQLMTLTIHCILFTNSNILSVLKIIT